MHDTGHSDEDARQTLEELRHTVRTAPIPNIEDAPAWLSDVEEMREFFSTVAPVWDRVFGTEREDHLYEAVAGQIEPSESSIAVLVLGCGTGLELTYLFDRAPNAFVTGVDLAPGMLAELRRKFHDRMEQIRLIEQSYIGMPLGEAQFDYVVATLTVHHVALTTRVDLFRKIRATLKPSGIYIEGDQSTSLRREKEILYWYDNYISRLPGGDVAQWNYDITLSPETEASLLHEAGFTQVDLVWERRDHADEGLVVMTAQC